MDFADNFTARNNYVKFTFDLEVFHVFWIYINMHASLQYVAVAYIFDYH